MSISPPAPPVLAVSALRKQYGSVTAVEEVSFSVGLGEIVGLLGPNGAGKTTAINMILGVLEPSAGTITIDGLNLATQRVQALTQTNFAAISAPLPGNMTVLETLQVFGMLYEVKELRARIEETLQEFNLESYRRTKLGVLSSGEQTRVGLAKAMLNRPKLLLLDEPTASLDPSVAREIRLRIRRFAQSGTCGVLWTSHNMHEVTEVCDRVLFLSRGRVLLEGNPKTLPEEHQKENLEELFITVAREPLTLHT